MKKQYVYSEEQVNELYKYLIQKPMLEAEKLVTILRNPVKLEELAEQKDESTEQ